MKDFLNETTKSILLVEDDEITALAEKKELELKGYRVFHVASGEEAVKWRWGINSIDLILMDIDLGPGMDGTEAARRILMKIDAPIVFISACTKPEIVEKTEKIASYGYIVKGSGIVALDTSIKMAFRLFKVKRAEKQRRETLRLNEEKYRLMVLNNPGITLIQNMDGGIDYISPQTERTIGYTPEEIREMDIFDHVYSHDVERVKKIHEKTLKGNDLSSGEYRFIHKKGNLVWLRHTAKKVYVDGRLVRVQSYIEDITERKVGEERLKAIEVKFKGLFDNMTNAVAIYRAVDDGNDFVFMDFNKGAERIEKIKKKDVIGKKVTKVFPGVESFGILDVFRKVWRTGKAEHFPMAQYKDERISGWKENYIFKIPTGEIVAVYEDITIRKQAEEALKLSEEKYRGIVTSAQEGVWIIDNKGITVFVNKRMAEMLGYDESDMLGRPFLDFMDEQVREEALSLFQKRIQGISEKHDFRFSRKDGSPVWTIVSTNPILDEKGNMKAALAMVTDITERKKAEEDLIKSRDLLAMTESLSKVGGWEWDVDNKEMSWTEETFRIHGMDSDDFPEKNSRLIEKSIACYGEKEREIIERAFQKCISRGIPYDFEFSFTSVSGKPIWVYTMGKPVVEKGKVKKVRGVISDITEQVLAKKAIQDQLNEKEIILREVHHRVKNNMASIGNMLKLQADSLKNEESRKIIMDAISRIESSRLIYDKLLFTNTYRETSAKNYLEDLVKAVYNIFSKDRDVVVNMEIDDIVLNVKILFPLGLIINELVTNSMKYAFNGMKKGKIDVLLQKRDKRIMLTVKDNGKGMPSEFKMENTSSFGLLLVKMLSKQLKGDFSIKNRKGTVFSIEFYV